MSEQLITLPDGRWLSMAQALELNKLMAQEGEDNCHWHFNTCECCVTLHSHDACWVIDRDGDSDLFPVRGCDCEDHP